MICPRSVRQVGKTDFAKPENYETFTLTDQHREEFFRDGATLLKGVLTPAIVAKLHAFIAAIPQDDTRQAGNVWMVSDEMLDFYLFGPLGNIAAQVFQSPQAVTSPSSANRSDTTRFHQQKATQFYQWMAYRSKRMSNWGSAIQVPFYGISKIGNSLGSNGWCAWHADHQSKQVCCSHVQRTEGRLLGRQINVPKRRSI